MNLDDLDVMRKIDTDNMLEQIQMLPDQLKEGWELGKSNLFPLIKDIRQIIIAGMGGSAIGGDMIASYLSQQCRVPILVHREYDLPAWAHGPETLVIACSHSGNTEETLSIFEQSIHRECSLAALSTGGELKRWAGRENIPHWTFEHHGMPRAAVGFSFSMLLAMIYKNGLIDDPVSDLEKAIAAMQMQQVAIDPPVPASKNPAKQLAQKLMGQWVAIIGSGYMAPIARRWKCQMNELAKAWTQFEFLPEADHNTLAGVKNPTQILRKTVVVFLDSNSDHPRNKLRSELTQKEISKHGLISENYIAQGETPLSNMWAGLHFGDYVSYYLAMIYNTDPSPITAIENLKKAMK